MTHENSVSLKNICLFNNFAAIAQCSIPNSFNLNLSLFNKYAKYINLIIEDNTYAKVIIFGNYKHSEIKHPNVNCLDFPSDTNDKSVQHTEITDSWAFTTNNIYKTYHESQNLFLLSTEYLAMLEDPRPILLALKKLMLTSKLRINLLLIHQNDTYKPKNMHYLWNLQEIQTFLRSSGFKLETIHTSGNTHIFSVECNQKFYQDYLNNLNINPSLLDASLLILTTEDASISPTGGIGTYIKNLKELSDKFATLYCQLSQKHIEDQRNTFFVSSFMESSNNENYFNGLGLIENIKSILYTLPNISTIEFQDYSALGFRIVQAKKTGILPQYLTLRVFLHGNMDHIAYGEKGEGSIDYNNYQLKTSIKDQYICKYADECFAPSHYIKNLLEEEYQYKFSNISIKRLPFSLNTFNNIPKTDIKKITQIVFIGKYNSLKGWYDFIEALNTLNQNKKLSTIKKVIALSPGTPPQKSIDAISSLPNFQSLHLDHQTLLDFIKNNLNNTLFIAPTSGDSYSLVAVELLLYGALFIGYNKAGIIEAVDNPEYIRKYFCNHNIASLTASINNLIHKTDYTEDNNYLNEHKYLFLKKQEKINSEFIENIEKKSLLSNIQSPHFTNVSSEISIVIPVFNTELKYIKELLISICSLRLKPQEVIFIDDGSETTYMQPFTNLVAQYLKNQKFRIITQTNKGLAGARNRGLSESKTKYTYYMDSDDVFLPSTLYTAWISMQVSPEMVATSGFPFNFKDENLNAISISTASNSHFWKPIGHNISRAFSLKENHYIAASAFLNNRIIKEFGGWDDSDKTTWEDWAFYTRLAWHNYTFSIIPTIGYLYRDTPNSMSKTYNHFLGRRRLIRNLDIVPKLDANVIYSLINNTDDFQREGDDIKRLKKNISKLMCISIIRSPIKKYQAYKALLNTYREL